MGVSIFSKINIIAWDGGYIIAGKCNFFFTCKLPFYIAVFEVVFKLLLVLC